MPSMCNAARSCTRAVNHEGMRARGGRRLWCQLSLIRGLFSDLMPGQAWKEVTFSKVCLKGDDMWMCWHRAPLHHHNPPLCQKSNCACFLFSWFLLIFPRMQHSARENTIIVRSNADPIRGLSSNTNLERWFGIWDSAQVHLDGCLRSSLSSSI